MGCAERSFPRREMLLRFFRVPPRSISISSFFLLDRGKILILLLLAESGIPSGAQNIDSTRLTAKILRSKGLGMRTPSGSVNAAGRFESGRTIPIVSLPHPRSRLLVTTLGYFSVEGCGKGEEGYDGNVLNLR